MLIKFDAEQVEVDRLKMFMGQKVGSKAFYHAALEAPGMADEIRLLRQQVETLKMEKRVLEQTLERGRSAAALFLEACGQGDLLNDV